MTPQTRYAVTVDGAYIAYQVVGSGPVDIVFVHAFVSHVEIFWELPTFKRLVDELSATARVIIFDKRGVGLSDRLRSIPTLEARMDDLRAVLDASGAERPLIIGDGEGTALAALFAATYPERTLGLVLWSPGVRVAWAPDYPWGMRDEDFERRLARRTEIWGDADSADETARMTFSAGDPVTSTPAVAQWLVKIQRYGTAPGDLVTFSRMWFSTDARSALPAIQVSTMVLVREEWPEAMLEASRWTAEQVAGARLESLHGMADDPYLGDVTEVAHAIARFIATIRNEQAAFSRVLATVLFTDIVGATERASALGDRAWKALVEQHHSKTRALLGRFRGDEVDTAGDGFFATFDGPGRAVHCADALIQAMAPLGMEIRAGIHTGEVETVSGKVGGLAVMIGARIGALAGPSQIFTSQTVRDLTAGSGIAFRDVGEFPLKGVSGTWRISRADLGEAS